MDQHTLLVAIAYGADKNDPTLPDPLMRRILDTLVVYYQGMPAETSVALITAGITPGTDTALSDVYANYLEYWGVPCKKKRAEHYDTDGELAELAKFIAENPRVGGVVIFNKSWHMPRTRLLFWIHRKRYNIAPNVKWVSIPSSWPRQVCREVIAFPQNLVRLCYRILTKTYP